MTRFKPLTLTLAAMVASGCGVFAADQSDIKNLFSAHGDLEVTVWAESRMLFNPTNIDVDKDGRIWVAEGVNYRRHYDRKPEGDRIVVLEDTDGDGKADESSVFVQEPFLRAPLGVAVLDNKIVVSMTPDMVVYTDVNRDRKFDPGLDEREVLLTGFNGRAHDHSLHSVTVGPDGQWYWNAGNCGALFTDRSGRTFRIGSAYNPKGDLGWSPSEIAGMKSDDGHVYVGGFSARMNPDGSYVNIIGYNYRNSYEQTITSFGDVFQNDNDDPPACRTSFVLEYGNAGFCSFDGKRSWRADRRPGQSIEIAEWRQEDPGTMPPGDVYGGGSPTGIAFYEGGALGNPYGQGLLLSCEAARNVVFGYLPKADGAGYKLERFDFLTTNTDHDFAGADFKGGGRSVTGEAKTLFRPSDVLVGVDGAIYVSDWFDPRVGGHQDLDESLSGAIYRVAPKGFTPRIPSFDLTTRAGQLEALKSTAVNVRSLGFNRLKQQGSEAVSAVAGLLGDHRSPIRARAVWLLSQLGNEGIELVEPLLGHSDPQMRVVAYRALRRQNHDFLPNAMKMSKDASPAVRREVALSMRDVPFSEARDILIEVARRFDGSDRYYLEAFGTGCTGKEAEMHTALSEQLGGSDATQWDPSFARLAWRLIPEAAIGDFKVRALSDGLSDADRKAALVVLGYLETKEAADAVIEVATKTSGKVRTEAVWWLLNRKDSQWKEFGVAEALKREGIYDPDNIQLMAMPTPEPPESKLPPVEDVLALTGDKNRGKLLATACFTCHRIEGQGIDYGPTLTGWGKTQTREVIARSVMNPSADIAHGYQGTEIRTKDGLVIHGMILSEGDPVIIRSMGGVDQTVPKDRIQRRRRLNRSLMLSVESFGFGAQEVADIVAYLKSI